MDTKQEIRTPQDPQVSIREDLKSERAQDPAMAGPVLRIQLKSERVQAPAAGAFVCELAVSEPQPVTIELAEPLIAITLHGRANGGQADNPASSG